MTSKQVTMTDCDGDQVAVQLKNKEVYFTQEVESDFSSDGGHSFEMISTTISVPVNDLREFLRTATDQGGEE